MDIYIKNIVVFAALVELLSVLSDGIDNVSYFLPSVAPGVPLYPSEL